MNTRLPTPVRALLNDFTIALLTHLPDLVTGLYLHGSLALDDFDERQSDIDFVALLSRAATADEIDRLRAIHRTLAAQYPRWLLEGSYVLWRDLGKVDDVSPGPTHHDNQFSAAGTFDINLVTWWVLRQHGIALIGPWPDELPLSVDWDLLVARMRDNLNSYWATFLYRPARIAWLLTDYGVQWAVLGVLRQYYTFVAHNITSKRGAGEYALAHLPVQWHRIIRTALRLRQDAGESDGRSKPEYRSKAARAADTYRFLRFIINYCNSLPS